MKEDLRNSNERNELRKRLNGNLIDDITKESLYEEEQACLESHSYSQTAKVILNDGKEKQKNMTMSIHSDFTNTTTKVRPNKSSSPPMTTTTTTAATTMIKRSLSESSVEELHRSKEAADSAFPTRKMWKNEMIMSPESESAPPKQSLRSIDEGDSGKKRNKRNHFISDVIDVGIRIVIVLVFIKLETTTAFHRNIHIEELWLYKNPRTVDFVSPRALVLTVIICPFIVTLLHLYFTGDRRDFRAANWVWTLGLCLNGVATSLLKISAGRPRPDFFYRCFPDGVLVANVTPTAVNFNCTGKWRDINEGYKSFPSGHSSFAFTSFGFIALYWCGKLHTFNTVGRGETWRLFAAIWPWFLASLIAVSRTCDYHHHWQDVLAGAVIGTLTAVLCYRQYYPSIFSPHSHIPLPRDGCRVSFISNCDYIGGDSSKKLRKFNLNGKKNQLLVNEDQTPLICGDNNDDDDGDDEVK